MSANSPLSRADLEAFDAQPEGSGSEKRFRCPFCQAGERAFHVNFATGAFNCKRASCCAQGLLSDFWKHPPGAPCDTMPKFSRREVQRARLAQAFGLAEQGTNAAPPAPEAVETSNWREMWESAEPIESSRSTPGAAYLEYERGLSVEVASAAGVRFCLNWAPSPDGKIYRAGAAVLFPTSGERGDVVAVSGRYLRPANGRDGRAIKTRTGGDAKWGAFVAPARIAGEWISPFDRRLDAVIIAEGQADALTFALCGFPALASNGKNLTPWMHRRAGLRRVLVASDGDEGGDEAALRWTAYLSDYGAKCQRLRPENAKDWNEMLTGNRSKGTQGIGRDALADWVFARHFEFLDCLPEAPLH